MSQPAELSTNDRDHFLDLYRHMASSRELDRLEERFTAQGDAFFHVSGAGHEGSAALARHLTEQDYLHCHYRDKALMLARGIPVEQFFLSLFCKDASHSRGRQMSAHLSDPERHVLSLVGPVGNNALQAAGVAMEIRENPELFGKDSLVLCALGDGTSQQGEVLEAIAEAVRWQLPVLFLIEDNTYSISTRTPGMTFYSQPGGEQNSFYGLDIQRCDGRSIVECDAAFAKTVSEIRDGRGPAIMVMKTDRLSSHTNADDQRSYRSDDDIDRSRSESDPIQILRQQLIDSGVAETDLTAIDEKIVSDVAAAADSAMRSADPQPEFGAKQAPPPACLDAKTEYIGSAEPDSPMTMLQSIREVLLNQLEANPRVTLYGEDLEDPKGDVFGLTKGLSRKYGHRVKNSPLAEASIVGSAAGRALVGGRPVAFLQFADFLPIAWNQIVSEIGSMYWRTDGGWTCPVIIMLTCGGYRPGLGPFHAQTLEAVACHTPGVDVMMPATAGDAAGMLNVAFKSNRPTLFFYPKSQLNDRDSSTSPDIERHWVPLGQARIARGGSDLTLVGWGNAVPRCLQAAAALADEGIEAEVIDLRCLSPWDEAAVQRSAEKTGHMLVVHEDNHSCGLGAEIVATIAAASEQKIKMGRVTRPDTFVPFNFANQLEVLPSYQRVLESACHMLKLDISWEKPPKREEGRYLVEAVGASPSDESVTINEWLVKAGDTVKEGDLLTEYEADKAIMDLAAPVGGEVVRLLVEVGDTAKVGAPLIELAVDENNMPPEKPLTQERPGTPIIKRRALVAVPEIAASNPLATRQLVGIAAIAKRLGSQSVTNPQLLSALPGKTAEDIERVTGIQARRRIIPGETVLSLASDAAKQALEEAGVSVVDMDMIVVSTGTPDSITPSLACRLLFELGGDKIECQAHDISAACSGYLYALQTAWDYLQTHPEGRVLVVTSEVLSPLVDSHDFNTAIIFGDAATATVLQGANHTTGNKLRLRRPVISAQGEPGQHLTVPLAGNGQFIGMSGSKVFAEGVRKMSQMLKRACAEAELEPGELDLVVPHQANLRIMEAIRNRLKLPTEKVYANIQQMGNTSSSTIPICLSEILVEAEPGQRLGLAAFGGGFTFGAAILDVV